MYSSYRTTVSTLYSVIKSTLRNPDREFLLCLPPRQQLVEMEQTIFKAGLAPASNVTFVGARTPDDKGKAHVSITHRGSSYAKFCYRTTCTVRHIFKPSAADATTTGHDRYWLVIIEQHDIQCQYRYEFYQKQCVKGSAKMAAERIVEEVGLALIILRSRK